MAAEKDLSELIKEFVAELMTYVRQRGKETVTEVVVQPLTMAGIKIGLIIAAAALMVLAAVFLGIFMVIGFATLFGGSYLWGYLCSGVLVMVLAAIVLLIMSRLGKEEKSDKEDGDGRTERDRGGSAGQVG